MEFHEDAFDAAIELTAAALEEAEIDLNAEGAEQVAEFFSVLYKRIARVASGEDEKMVKPGTFEMFEDGKGEYRFRMKSANGQVIAVSEGYKKKEACIKGIESVKGASFRAKIKEV